LEEKKRNPLVASEMSKKQVSLKKKHKGENKTPYTYTPHTHTYTPHHAHTLHPSQVVYTVLYCIALWDSYLDQLDIRKKYHTVLLQASYTEGKLFYFIFL
jgi:hypothetical protein